MKLLTQEVLAELPPLYANENVADPIVVAKLFTPDSSWTWYITEGSYVDENGIYEKDAQFTGNKYDFLFFAFCDSGREAELGYVSLRELQNSRGPLGLSIERDLYWKPKPLSQVRQARKISTH